MTTTGARRRLTAADRREQILDVTHAIVASEGFHAATPARIASASGVTRPVLYQQFGSISGLFVALVDREAARAASQFAEAAGKQAPGADPFIATFEGVLDAIDAHPDTWRLFLFPPAGAPPELHARLAEAQDAVRAYLNAELVRALPALPDPEYAAVVLHAAGRELLQLRLSDPAGATRARLLALVKTWSASATTA